VATKKSAVSEYLAEIGRKGGQAKVKKGLASLPEEERKAIARMAANARWARQKAKGAKRGRSKK
jgi:hypothetical protein